MDQHHQNYDSFNDFNFVNSLNAGSENYQEKDLNFPSLMNQVYDSRGVDHSLYNLPTEAPLTSGGYQNIQPYQQMPPEPVELHQKPPIPVPQDYSTQTPLNIEQFQPPIKANEEIKNPEPCPIANNELSPDVAQNSMMKALGVIRKDDLSTSSSKRRKRIVLLNDDSDEEEDDLKKEVLAGAGNEESNNGSNNEENSNEADNECDGDEPENLIDLGALKAKFLLKNAVIIQGPDKKKKKSRLLDRLVCSADLDQLQF